MLSGMSMSEYVHWRAIYETEPFPEERADMRAAEILRMQLIAAGAKSTPPLSDFIPDWWGEHKPQQQTPEQMKANMSLIKAASKRKK